MAVNKPKNLSGTTPSADDLLPAIKVISKVGLNHDHLLAAAEKEPTLASLLTLDVFGDPSVALQKRTRKLPDVIRTVHRRLGDGPTARAADPLLQVSPEYHGLPYARRYSIAIELWGEDYRLPRYFNRQKNQILTLFASELALYQEEELLLSTRRHVEQGEPTNGALAVDLLRRYEHYYRIWSDISGLASDIALYYEYRDSKGSPEALERKVQSSLYFLGNMDYHVALHTEVHGGVWIFSKANLMDEVPDRLWQIALLSNLTQHQHSMLWGPFVQSPLLPMTKFYERLLANPDGSQVLDDWRALLASCDCPAGLPQSGCKGHEILAAGKWYMATVESEFYKLIQWYSNIPTLATSPVDRAVRVHRQFPEWGQDLTP